MGSVNGMKVLIVYAHPSLKSFNRAILEAIIAGLHTAGHETRIKDLYQAGFNPLLDEKGLALANQGVVPQEIRQEQQDLLWADGLVFLYPLWWFDRPAILKGWFDRVFTHGFAFKYTDQGMEGLLNHRKALVIVTTGGSIAEFEQLGAADYLVRPTTDGTLALCGVTNIVDKVLYSVTTITDQERQQMLADVRQLAANF